MAIMTTESGMMAENHISRVDEKDATEDPTVFGLETAYEITVDMHSEVTTSTSATNPTDEEEEEDELVETKTCSASTLLQWIKTIFSAALLLFSIVILSAAIFQKQTTATSSYNLHPAIAFTVFWVLLLWLALMEGGLNCMVGLKPLDKQLYRQSHPRTHACTRLAHQGNHLQRFIVGRQYLDLAIVFTTSFMVSMSSNASVLGLPETVCNIFLLSGLAVILITIVVGQLIAQINSAHYMLDFMNNYAMLITTHVALVVEATGMLHAVYLVQFCVSKVAGKPIPTKTRSTRISRAAFWLRVALSVGLTLLALVITLTALFSNATTLWSNVPAWVALLVFLLLILISGIMEGLQIALMAVVHLPKDELEHHAAFSNYEYMFAHKNRLQAFLVGRQICQTILMFVIARITTLDSEADNLWGVPDGVQQFLVTGVLGALLTTIVASLSWRVLASSFPLSFLANPLSRPIILVCLLLESTGICTVAWPMAKLCQEIFGFRPDDEYLQNARGQTKDEQGNLKGDDNYETA
jgi:hypothetical protein